MRDGNSVLVEEFRKGLEGIARQAGFVAYNYFPGLILVKPGPLGRGGRLIFAHVLGPSGHQRAEVIDWQLLLEGLGDLVEVYTWRPKNLSEIRRVLECP